jgi:hypothetical protein
MLLEQHMCYVAGQNVNRSEDQDRSDEQRHDAARGPTGGHARYRVAS